MSDASGGQSNPFTWNPSEYSLWAQIPAQIPDAAHTVPVMLRHPTAPAIQKLTVDSEDKLDGALQWMAFDYLKQANEYLKQASGGRDIAIPPAWLDALDPKSDIHWNFGWVPIGWPHKNTHDPEHSGDPLVSFRVERKRRDGEPDTAPAAEAGQRVGSLIDESIILFASEKTERKSKGKPKYQFLGSDFGIRVIMHVRRPGDGNIEVRITGMSASLAYGRYAPGDWTDPANRYPLLEASVEGGIRQEIATALDLQEDSVSIQGMRFSRVGDAWRVERRCAGLPKSATGRQAIPFSYIFDGDLQHAGRLTRATPLVADANAPSAPPKATHATWVFPSDPIRRPASSDDILEDFRTEKVYVPDPCVLAYGNPALLEVALCPGFVGADGGYFHVGPPPRSPKTISLSGKGKQPPIRSNDFSALNGYQNIKELFERFDAYGMSPYEYFQMAKLPVKVAYRSGIVPGRGADGQTVNARVHPEGLPPNAIAPGNLTDRPGLVVHLALGNLSRRDRKPWGGKDPSPAETLGIAADERWIWHEIGHVLLMASVGELEFRFAHSPGDALAAIATDPRSTRTDQNWRGATFPWVFVPRRHDRCVTHGWSWGGTMHHQLANVGYSVAPRRKGYSTEQILSSSLFRMYLCLGGDTMRSKPKKPDGAKDTKQERQAKEPDEAARNAASHYSVYLIMRAIQLLGTAGIVVANEPDHFVSALIDADIGTEEWDVTYRETAFPKRVGGCAHKAIRWAFEAQGMYTLPGIVNAPGLPPPVDIYIKDLRPQSISNSDETVDYGPGTYVPVSLDWDPNQTEKSSAPEWQSSASAIQVKGSEVFVTVGNRGSRPAKGVTVSVWSRSWAKGTEPPEWHDGKGWTRWEERADQEIPAGKTRKFGPFSHATPNGRSLLFVQTTCPDDRANTDPATHFPCTQHSTRLVDLVALDNNLGLRVVGGG